MEINNFTIPLWTISDYHFPFSNPKNHQKVLHGPLHRAAQMQLLQDLVAIDALEAPQGQQLHLAATRRHDTMTRAAMELADLADLKMDG